MEGKFFDVDSEYVEDDDLTPAERLAIIEFAKDAGEEPEFSLAYLKRACGG